MTPLAHDAADDGRRPTGGVADRLRERGERARARLWGWAIGTRVERLGRHLGSAERRLVEAAADTLFPASDIVPRSGSEAGMVAYIEGYLEQCRPTERVLVHLLLAFTELSPLAFGPSPRTFTQLDAEQRLRLLRGASESRIYLRRIAFTSLRALMTMGYLSHPEVERHVGIVHDTDPFGLGDGPAVRGRPEGPQEEP